MAQKPYDSLTIIPRMVAETVVQRKYTGNEISDRQWSADKVRLIEQLRSQMTEDQRNAFAKYADDYCRAAYERKADWFMKCIHSKSNRGRDQLYMFVTHWMAGYLIRENEGSTHPGS
jgi:hypothetical protein